MILHGVVHSSALALCTPGMIYCLASYDTNCLTSVCSFSWRQDSCMCSAKFSSSAQPFSTVSSITSGVHVDRLSCLWFIAWFCWYKEDKIVYKNNEHSPPTHCASMVVQLVLSGAPRAHARKHDHAPACTNWSTLHLPIPHCPHSYLTILTHLLCPELHQWFSNTLNFVQDHSLPVKWNNFLSSTFAVTTIIHSQYRLIDLQDTVRSVQERHFQRAH
jgi:hypothetical protein